MKKIIYVVLILTCNLLHAQIDDDDLNQPLHGKTFLSPRSQSVNAARQLVLFHRYINLPCKDFYGAFSITPEYGGSFRPERIAEYFWSNDTLVITGSQVTNRDNETQILADYFGLGPLFQSTVAMKPEIRTALVDFDLYLGYQDYYLRIHVPYVWTKWHYKLRESISPNVPIPDFYPPLYMDTGAVAAPAQSFIQAIAGNLTWGQVSQPLKFGRIDGAHSQRGFAEAQIALGWNFINDECEHAGFNIRGSIPAGTRSKAIFLFEPILGNGHHPELGIGFTGHALVWEKDGQQTVEIWTDINLTHLFNSRQRRSFDLINPSDPNNIEFKGFGTRYILAKEFDAVGNYTGVSQPAINITTLECDVSVAIQVDLVIMASYQYCNYTIDVGYNAWLRSREMISNREKIPNNTYALKGIQNVSTGIGLSNATQSTATIFGNEFTDQATVADPFPPIFFNDSQIDESSAQASRGFTHKLFGNFGYSWDDCYNYAAPFLGIGGEVEFEGLNPRHEIKANKNSISQWGVWIKGGFGF